MILSIYVSVYRHYIIPIPKSGHNDKSKTSNYRPITLSSMYGKIINILILKRHTDLLPFSNLQFGFKAHHSTDKCTFVAKKVIQYYLNNGSEVYGCTLDMQKAFDEVNLLKLFAKLQFRQLPAHMLRLLFFLLYYGVLYCVFTGMRLFQIL